MLALFLIGFASATFSQIEINLIRVSGHPTNISFHELVSILETNHRINFFYLDSWVEHINVGRSYQGKTIEYTLNDLLKGQNISVEFLYGYAFILVKDRTREVVRDEILSNENISIERLVLGNIKTAKWGETLMLSGKIVDNSFSESIIGSSIYANEEKISSTTDEFGEFKISLPAGEHVLAITSVGYSTKYIHVELYANAKIEIVLENLPITLNEVIIVDESSQSNFNNSASGIVRLSAKTIQELPSLMGEVDLIKNIQQLPGVSTGGDGGGGLHVRGGSEDQNLVLLDEMLIFNPSHLFGFFSAFHPNAIHDATFYKDVIPSRYGGRISSVVDVTQKDGDKEKLNASGGVGIVNSRILVDAPIIKDKLSVLVAGRGSYLNWLLDNSKNIDLINSNASFIDLTGKLSAYIDKKGKITSTYYLSHDEFQFANDTIYTWENQGFSLIHDQIINSNTSINSSVAYSSYLFQVADHDPQKSFSWQYGISNLKVKTQLFWRYKNNKINIGADLMTYKISKGEIHPMSVESRIEPVDLGENTMGVLGLFANNEFKLHNRINLNMGLRFSLFGLTGIKKEYLYANGIAKSNLSIVDSVMHERNDIASTYYGLEPRILAKFTINPTTLLRLGYNYTFQYLHILSNSSSISPIDIWTPSSRYLRPQIGSQYSLGIFKNFNKIKLTASVEYFYKNVLNTPEYKNGAQFILKENIETEIINSTSRTNGLEVSISKEGRLSGAINYTYSKSERKTNSTMVESQINNNSYYKSNYDRPHDLNISTNYKLTKRYTLSTVFNLASGRPLTLPSEKFEIEGMLVSNYTNRNEYRMPLYHRLDISVLINPKHKVNRRWKSTWVWTLYNVYGSKNAYSVYVKNNNEKLQAYKLSTLGTIFPSLTYNFEF